MRLSPASAPRGLREPGSVAARLAAALPNLRRLCIATDSLLDTGAHLRQTEPLVSVSLLSPSASACSSLSAAAATADAAGVLSPRACGTPRSNFFGHDVGSAGAGADVDSCLDMEVGGVGVSMEVWLLRLLGPRLQALTLQPLVREMPTGAPRGAIHYLPLTSADAFTTSQDPESSPLWAALCSLKGLRELDLGCQLLPAWLFPAVPRPRAPPPRGGAASTPAAWLAAAAGAGGSAGAGGGPRPGVCVQSWMRMALSGSAASGSAPGVSSSGGYDSGCYTDGDTSDDEAEEQAAAAACGGLAAVWPQLTRLAAGGILGLAAPSDDGGSKQGGYSGGAAPSGLALPPRGFRQLQLREPQSVAALAAVYRATAAAEALAAAAEARAVAAEARGGLRPRQLWAAAAAEGFSLGATSGFCHGGAADASGYTPGTFMPPSTCLYGEPPAVSTALGQGYEPDSPAVTVAAAAAAGTSSCPASPAAAAKAAQSGIHAPCSASCSSCAAALASTLGVLGQVMARSPGGGLVPQPNVLLLHTSHIAPWAHDGADASCASPLSSLSESPEREPHRHQGQLSRLQHKPQHQRHQNRHRNPQQQQQQQQQHRQQPQQPARTQHRPQQQQRSRDQRVPTAAVSTAAAADAAGAALARRLRERNPARRPSAAPHLPTHNEDEEGEQHKRRQQHSSFFTATRGAQRGGINSSEASSSDEDRSNDGDQECSDEHTIQPRHDLMADAVALLVRAGGRCRALTVRMSESPAAAGVTAGAAGAPPPGGGGSCCAGSFWRYGCRAAEGPHKPWLAALAPLDAAGLRTLTLCCFSFEPGDMATLAAALPGLRDGGCLVLEHCPLPASAAAELRGFAEVRCRGLPPPQPLLLSQRSQPQLALTRAAQELQDQLQLLRLRRRSSSGTWHSANGGDNDSLSAAVAAATTRGGASRFGGNCEGQRAARAPQAAAAAAATKPEAHVPDDQDDKLTWSRVRIAPWVEAAEARARAGRQAAAAAAVAALPAADMQAPCAAVAPISPVQSAAAACQAARANGAAPLQISGTPTSCYSTSSNSASSSSHTGPAGGSAGTGDDWVRPLQPRGRWQSDCGITASAAPPLPLLGSGGVQPCAAAATAMDAAARCGGKQGGGRTGNTCADSAPAYAASCTLACADDNDNAGEHAAPRQQAAHRQDGSGVRGTSSSVNSGNSGNGSGARVRRPAGNLALALRASASSQRRRAGASASPGS